MLSCFSCRLIAAGAVLAAATAGAGAGFAADEPVNIVKYRKAIMGANAGHMRALAAMARNQVSFRDTAQTHAQAIHDLSQNLARLFPEGTGMGDTEEDSGALQAIWEQPDEFQSAIESLQTESQALVELTEGDFEQAAFAQQVGALGKEGCGNCHDNFREED